MDVLSGKFIVIDGTDGSGKTTQLNILKTKLEELGHSVEVADFPQYNTKSAGLVEEYLSGKYGGVNDVNAYCASIFYAVDRYDASFKIRTWLKEGKIVLANRYTSANLGHQGSKVNNPLERKVFFNWLYDLEYNIFNIPKPNLSLILHVEAEIAQSLAKQRAREDWEGKTKDIHEENLEHLQKSEAIYLEIAQSFPDFKLIKCTNNNTILSREEISFLIWTNVRNIINPPHHEDLNDFKSSFSPIVSIMGTNENILNNRDKFFKQNQNNYQEQDKEEAEIKVVNNNSQEITINKNNLTAEQKIKIEKINASAKIPSKAHLGDAGYDLFSNEYFSITPYGQALVSTGVKMAIPTGHVGLIWDKSGIAKDGIKTMGGVIDENYRGEIKVVIKNLSELDYNIVPGQKVAQILIQKVADLEISEERVDDMTERQDNGFGSSGKF
jgi:dTMP kinase